MEFGILIPGISLPEKSQKEYGLRSKRVVKISLMEMSILWSSKLLV